MNLYKLLWKSFFCPCLSGYIFCFLPEEDFYLLFCGLWPKKNLFRIVLVLFPSLSRLAFSRSFSLSSRGNEFHNFEMDQTGDKFLFFSFLNLGNLNCFALWLGIQSKSLLTPSGAVPVMIFVAQMQFISL